MTYRVFVNHAHVFPASINPHGTVDRLLRLMDACGIDRAVCFAPFCHQCDGTEIEHPNDWLSQTIARESSRLLGFGTVDPLRADIPGQIRRVVELGFRGLKLHPNAQGFDLLSPPAMEVYAAAQEHDLFCSFHSGVHRSRLAGTRVIDFDEIAWNFPRLRFSLEHVGGYHFFNEALAVIFNHVPPPWELDKGKRCNVFAGLASVFSQERNRFWYLSDERLRELAAQVGARQMIFGLDFPYNGEVETKLGLRRIRELLDAEAQAQILGGNLARELRLADEPLAPSPGTPGEGRGEGPLRAPHRASSDDSPHPALSRRTGRGK